MKKLAPLFVFLAALLWAGMGIVTRYIVGGGYTTSQVAAIRAAVSALVMVLVLLVFDRSRLKIKLKDLPWFLGTGIGSFMINNLAYAETVQRANLSVAVVLLYTAPFFVVLLSALLFKERLTGLKIIALLLSFGGCILVVGPGAAGLGQGGTVTVLIGLCSGLAYSLYTIISKVLIKKYDSLTIVAYTFIVAAAGTLLICRPGQLLDRLIAAPERLPLMGLGCVLAIVCPYVLYSYALRHMESSKASIIASIEVAAASLYGVVLYQEKLTLLNVLGIVTLLAAVSLLQLKRKS